MSVIPVVDFSSHSLEQEDVSQAEQELVSAELHEAFTRVGFVFLQNTGITPTEVERVMDVSRHFFSQSEEQKSLYSRGRYKENSNHGWVSLQSERLNPGRPGDLKECFNITALSPHIPQDAPPPGPEPQTGARDVVKQHSKIGDDGNSSTLRSLFYPRVDSTRSEPGQFRCGEHSDYGSISLVFQSSPGIQVRSVSGQFLSVPCVPGAVLVNIADLMQRWTSDTFISAVHRVLLPPPGDASERQSLAFFVQPDDSALIRCCDGSNKYPPIRSDQYLRQRFQDSYSSK